MQHRPAVQALVLLVCPGHMFHSSCKHKTSKLHDHYFRYNRNLFPLKYPLTFFSDRSMEVDLMLGCFFGLAASMKAMSQ
jgi:hypothetical protein